MAMAKLHLPYDEFESRAEEFVAISNELGDGWELRRAGVPSNPERETVFLVKRLSMLVNDNDSSNENDGEKNDHTTLELLGHVEGLRIDEEDDPAIIESSGCKSDRVPSSSDVASTATVSPRLSVQLEYHIVHSFSYDVPVLYFNATHSNGKPLGLKDTWRLLSDRFVSSEVDRWGMVTQQEHPLLHCPFYHIHPCHTAKVMAQAINIQTGGEVVKVHSARGEGEKRKDGDELSNNLTCDAGRAKGGDSVEKPGEESSNSSGCTVGASSRLSFEKPSERLSYSSGCDHDADASGRQSFEKPKQEWNKTCRQSEPTNYLVTWLSTFGPLVRLGLPLEYSTNKI